MSTTAHEDQFRSEPDLESECRKARAKSQDVCVWKPQGYPGSYYPSCAQYYTNEYQQYTPFDKMFKFCPFCGKKIEVKK